MKKYIHQLLSKQNITEQDIYKLFDDLKSSPVEQQAAILTLLQPYTLKPEQLISARNYVFEYTKKISCPYDIVDIVGTGGDNMGTFNISTAASIVLASCGVYVAKHGGRSVTSQSGSADVLELLGIPNPENSIEILELLKNNKFVYLSAGLFNDLLSHYRTLRKNLGIPSIFNIIAPLLNPLQPKRAIIGVYQKSLISPIIQVLKQLNYTHALVVHSHDGLDEISISAPTEIGELKNGVISNYTFNPSDLNIKQADLKSILGGSPKENAQIITQILMDELTGPKRDIVILNAAAGLLVAGKVNDFKTGVQMANEAIKTRKTAQLFLNLQLNNIK
jgi:anthranilate phosphoribosyltransferase